MSDTDPNDSEGLERFVRAQDRNDTIGTAVDELRRGRKTSHWMWFVFPQLAGLGRSAMAQLYAIADLAEAHAYLDHPVLGPRLRECAAVVASIEGRSAQDVFGGIDAQKLWSSMTLFARVGSDAVFDAVLRRWFGGELDPGTVQLLPPA